MFVEFVFYFPPVSFVYVVFTSARHGLNMGILERSSTCVESERDGQMAEKMHYCNELPKVATRKSLV